MCIHSFVHLFKDNWLELAIECRQDRDLGFDGTTGTLGTLLYVVSSK